MAPRGTSQKTRVIHSNLTVVREMGIYNPENEKRGDMLLPNNPPKCSFVGVVRSKNEGLLDTNINMIIPRVSVG